MGTQWVIVEGMPWRVLRVGRGFRVEGLWVIEGEEAARRHFPPGPDLTPSPSPEGRRERETPGADASSSFCHKIAECLKTNGYRGEGVLLGLAAWRAAVAELGPQPLEVERDHEAMALALEGELPWAAEEFVADFVRVRSGFGVDNVGLIDRGQVHGRPNGAVIQPADDAGGLRLPLAERQSILTSGSAPGGRAETERGHLGFAVLTEELLAWLAEWEQVGIWVQGICPWSLIRVQGLVRERAVGDNDLVVMGEDGGDVSLVQLVDGMVAKWEWLPEGVGIRERLMVDGLGWNDEEETRNPKREIRKGEAESHVSVVELREEIVEGLRELVGEKLRWVDESKGGGANQAGRILTGRDRAWVDWRRGVLADPYPYRAVRGLALATALMWLLVMGTLIVGLHRRAGEYESRAKSLTEHQSELYRNLMPGQKVPIGIRRRLESEVARLKAERGDQGASAGLVSTPEILERGLSALPESVRMRIKSIEIDGPRFTLDCETQTIADATAIVEAMSQNRFEVEAPRTELLNGIVPLRIVAMWKGNGETVNATGPLTTGASPGGRGEKETLGANVSGSLNEKAGDAK